MIIKVFLLFIAGFSYLSIHAQTADEIISKYIENTGGSSNWEKLNGFKYSARINTLGLEMPLEVIQLRDGRQMSSAIFQGREIKQGVFDGNTLWNINVMTMAPETSDLETTENFKLNINDFPDPFINYRTKGYKVELMGRETIEGTETFKLKLSKEPIMIDGEKTEDISNYYFDADYFVPILIESEIKTGPAKGMIQQTRLSDYQEVSGLYFAFSTEVGVKGQPGNQTITIQSIELNPTIDDAIFKMPAK